MSIIKLNPNYRHGLHLPKDLVCFSHLRWDFVYQRPQHLIKRFAKDFRVFFIEEPIFDTGNDHIQATKNEEGVWIVVPHLKQDSTNEKVATCQKKLLDRFFYEHGINQYIFWYYTPMSLSFTEHFEPSLIIYDCMDELSAFKFAPPGLTKMEAALMKRAQLVFTGGHSLYEAKKNLHKNIYPFPSSIDKQHFRKARMHTSDPVDQAGIPHPRFGFSGVVDERFDIDLLDKTARAKPDWHFIIVGPVVKIDPSVLPKRSNIHYLGGKSYHELPEYLGGWDIAIIPFALNESTRFISPTKTPEYLAAGKPVISTSIRDVVYPYQANGLVYIADTSEEFIKAAEKELMIIDKSSWLKKVDEFLACNSWDNTWAQMMEHIAGFSGNDQFISQQKTKEQLYV